MSRLFSSSFRQPTSPDNDPLLSHKSPSSRSDSISMHNLSQQASRSPAVSPSPPPSFYRSNRHSPRAQSSAMSPSPSRGKGNGRVIQFTAPPPPIATSVLLPRHIGREGSNSRVRADGEFDGAGSMRRGSPQMSLVRSRRGSGGLDPLLALSRRERALQRELQELLDAQSEGLIQGFGGQDEGSEAGSSTPTYNSTRSRSTGRREVSAGVVPVRQPKKKILSLRGARRGLLRDMGELASIKSEEVDIFLDSIAQREDVLKKVGLWEERIQAFQKQLSTVANPVGTEDEEGRELAELRNEERAVENEIREMEDRLAQMRARQKWIKERVREGENKREARLSSYRGALKEVEREVREFLRRPPLLLASSITIQNEDEGGGFMDLPVSRRTLGMAKELWSREIKSIEARRVDAVQEKEALEQGAKIWGDAVSAVVDFEDGLRVQMKGNMQSPDMLREQVRRMGKVIEKLEGNLKVAEENRWNLLICALGAELEAFREGEGILKGALGIINGVDGKKGTPVGDGEEVKANGVADSHGAQDGLARMESRQSLDREDSEDDGPPGELLVDHSHADGESSID